MSCYHPIYALKLRDHVPGTGKMEIKILPKRESYDAWCRQYGPHNILCLPCGHCVGCAIDYRRNWTTRLKLESLYHDKMCFLTLTYRDSCMPTDGRLKKRDLQLFMKRLRKEISPQEVRFFACGEYGSDTERCHYHVILFGYDFPDKKQYFRSGSKRMLYTSNMLDKIWSFGECKIGEVEYGSIAYVAQYSTKKKVGSSKYGDEFVLMSRRPGIGAQFFMDHPEVLNIDRIYGDFGNIHSVRVPRFFLKLADDCGVSVEDLRKLRVSMMRNVINFKKANRIYEQDLKADEYNASIRMVRREGFLSNGKISPVYSTDS